MPRGRPTTMPGKMSSDMPFPLPPSVFNPAFDFLAHLASCRRLAEFGVQSLQVGFDAPAVAKHEARHEAENRIVNLAGFRNRDLASGWLRLDLECPGPSERKLRIGNLGHQPIRRSFLDTLVGYGLSMFVDLLPRTVYIARREFFGPRLAQAAAWSV